MKIVFLDFDGVLKLNKPSPEHKCLLRLQNIINKTGASVVVSSSHRLYPKFYNIMVEYLLDYKIPHPIDVTPDLSDCKGFLRADEIQAWLNLNPQVKKFAIIDDWEAAKIGDNLFLTEFDTGITVDIMNNVISHLNG